VGPLGTPNIKRVSATNASKELCKAMLPRNLREKDINITKKHFLNV